MLREGPTSYLDTYTALEVMHVSGFNISCNRFLHTVKGINSTYVTKTVR